MKGTLPRGPWECVCSSCSVVGWEAERPRGPFCVRACLPLEGAEPSSDPAWTGQTTASPGQSYPVIHTLLPVSPERLLLLAFCLEPPTCT